MGLLVDGKWRTDWYDTSKTNGCFTRKATSFRSWVTQNGSAGPSRDGGFKAEPDRYHLYVSLVNAFMGDDGWTFLPGDDVIADSVNNKTYLHQVYTAARSGYASALV